MGIDDEDVSLISGNFGDTLSNLGGCKGCRRHTITALMIVSIGSFVGSGTKSFVKLTAMVSGMPRAGSSWT